MQLLARSKQNFIVQSWPENNGQTWLPVTKTVLPNLNSGIDKATNTNFQLLVYNPLKARLGLVARSFVLKSAVSADSEHWADANTFENERKGELNYTATTADDASNIYITYTFNRANTKFVHLKISSTNQLLCLKTSIPRIKSRCY